MSAPKYHRVLLKLSGEALGNPETGHNLDAEIIANCAREIKAVQELGVQVAVVVGGGNIFRGLAGVEAGISRTQGDSMGMLATVINALALQSGLEKQGVDTRVMTAIQMPDLAEPFIRRRAIRHLDKDRVVIFGAGTGNPYFTTDSAAALRASEIEADVVFKGTKVDGVYDKDPNQFSDAVKYDTLTFNEAIAKRLKIMDTAAFSLCLENEIPILVFDFFKPGEFLRAFSGKKVGTTITPEPDHQEPRA